jgi:hypothetical protein
VFLWGSGSKSRPVSLLTSIFGEIDVPDGCGGRACEGRSASGVEAGDEFAVGGARGGEVLVSLVEFEFQVDDLLFEVGDAVRELVDVGRRGEPGLVPGLLAERGGQASFELLVAGGEADGALVRGEQVGL